MVVLNEYLFPSIVMVANTAAPLRGFPSFRVILPVMSPPFADNATAWPMLVVSAALTVIPSSLCGTCPGYEIRAEYVPGFTSGIRKAPSSAVVPVATSSGSAPSSRMIIPSWDWAPFRVAVPLTIPTSRIRLASATTFVGLSSSLSEARTTPSFIKLR